MSKIKFYHCRIKKEESTEIERLIGIAVGLIGMDYDTFIRLTPDEFNAVFNAWKEKRDAKEQDEWNRMRLLATITVSPHCKNKIHPEKLLPLPWDKAQKKPAIQAGVKILSREERRERIKRLKERMNV